MKWTLQWPRNYLMERGIALPPNLAGRISQIRLTNTAVEILMVFEKPTTPTRAVIANIAAPELAYLARYTFDEPPVAHPGAAFLLLGDTGTAIYVPVQGDDAVCKKLTWKGETTLPMPGGRNLACFRYVETGGTYWYFAKEIPDDAPMFPVYFGKAQQIPTPYAWAQRVPTP
jgi:hypothetical protein